MTRTLAIAAAMAAAVTGLAQAQDAGAGKDVFKKCASCHAVGEGAKSTISGPVLNGLEGRKAGSAKGFDYSAQNKKSSLTWDRATFLDYIKDPKAKIPDTYMVFPGIKNEGEAADLWAYLRQFGPDGKMK